MSFMEPEVFKSRVVTLTDSRGESTCLPYDVLDTNERNAVDFLACFESIAERPEAGTPEAEAVKLLSQFMESYAPLASVEISKREVWVGRLSAPGYLDCTAWSYAESREEAEERLREDYGVDDDEAAENHAETQRAGECDTDCCACRDEAEAEDATR